jgi:thiamine-phosphate pyrophosphorylase
MKLCLVTDRRRLGAAVGARPGDWHDVLREQVQAAARAGVDYVQVREGDLEAAELAALVRSLLVTIAGSGTMLLVNDRIDVALATGAHGVHLKEQGILPDVARRIAPAPFVIGCSVHTTAAVDARKAADFLIAGTVLSTASKRAPEYLNEDGLRRIVRAAAEQPVLGIGGLDVASIPLLRASGAAGLAAIGVFIPVGGKSVSEFVQKRVQELRFALDHSARRT